MRHNEAPQKSILNDTLMLLSPCRTKQAVHRSGGKKNYTVGHD